MVVTTGDTLGRAGAAGDGTGVVEAAGLDGEGVGGKSAARCAASCCCSKSCSSKFAASDRPACSPSFFFEAFVLAPALLACDPLAF